MTEEKRDGLMECPEAECWKLRKPTALGVMPAHGPCPGTGKRGKFIPAGPYGAGEYSFVESTSPKTEEACDHPEWDRIHGICEEGNYEQCGLCEEMLIPLPTAN